MNSIPMDELADLMIVSHVELVKGEGGAASAVEGLGVAAAHATGDKCERCWKYSAVIGTHAGLQVGGDGATHAAAAWWKHKRPASIQFCFVIRAALP